MAFDVFRAWSLTIDFICIRCQCVVNTPLLESHGAGFQTGAGGVLESHSTGAAQDGHTALHDYQQLPTTVASSFAGNAEASACFFSFDDATRESTRKVLYEA